MLSSSFNMMNTPKTLFLSPFLPPHTLFNYQWPLPHASHSKPISISALILPPSSSPHPKSSSVQHLILPPSSSPRPQSAQVQDILLPSPSPQLKQPPYQPFRPPPSPLPPQYLNLDTNDRLEILANRLGLWFEYALLIPALVQEGFTSSTLEEITGIAGVEQNRIVVATQVRDSLVQSEIDDEILSVFDTSGAELLYEIRLLSNSQRAAAARYLVLNGFDARMAQELARAMKDIPRRRGEQGWNSFDNDLPGDCLAFMYFRQAHEHKSTSSPQLWRSALEKALKVLESENAGKKVLEELEGKTDDTEKDGAAAVQQVKVPVVRMRIGEVAEASAVAFLPVCRADDGAAEVEEAPWECGCRGDFGAVEAEKGWRRWVVLPGWKPLTVLKSGGVAVSFNNAKVLPWKANKWNINEAILVVADRGRKEVVANDGFYLVIGGGNGNAEEALKVERGLALKTSGVKESLGTVVLVVRPPREEYNDQISDEEWE